MRGIRISGRKGVVDDGVAIPFNIAQRRILRHHIVDDAVYEILNLRVAQVEDQLVAEVIFLAVGKFEYPVRMLFVQFAFRADHLRLQPDPELNSGAFGLFNQVAKAVRQLFDVLLPVAQPGAVVVARVFVAEPAVVEQKQVNAQLLAVFKQRGQLFFVEVEIRRFPVVQERQAVALPLRNPEFAGPAVQTAAGRAFARGGVRKQKRRGRKLLTRRQGVSRRIRVDTSHQAEVMQRVHFKRDLVITRPGQRSSQYLPIVFLGGLIQGHQKRGRLEQVGPGSQLGVQHLDAFGQGYLRWIHLPGPITVEVSQVVVLGGNVEVGRCVFVQGYVLFLRVPDRAPLFNDIVVLVRFVVQGHLKRILWVFQVHCCQHHTVTGRFAFVPDVAEVQRRVAVGMRDLNGGLQQVAAASRGIDGIIQTGIIFPALAVARNAGVFIRSREPLAQVNDGRVLVFVDPDNQRGSAGFDGDVPIAGGAHGSQNRKAGKGQEQRKNSNHKRITFQKNSRR